MASSAISATSPENSLTTRDGSKLQRALLDRLLLSEAIDIVGRTLDLFPNGRTQAGKSYIGGLAAVLMEYPRQVAMRAAGPVHGVARDTTFLPTVAVLIAWCERETAPMNREYQSAKRAAEQIEHRERDAVVSHVMQNVAKAWLTRADPRAQQLTGEGGIIAQERAVGRQEANREAMSQRRAETVAEYEKAGLTPVTIGRIPISIELARIMGVEPTSNRIKDAS